MSERQIKGESERERERERGGGGFEVEENKRLERGILYKRKREKGTERDI